MEQTKNMDLLISKMADPVFFKKICLLYDKKRNLKYKNKANIHKSGGKSKHRFFNESEECRKILDFVGNQDVTIVISKQETVSKACGEFSPGKYVKNYVDAAKSSHEMSDSFHKQRQDSKHSSSDSKHVSSVSDAIVPSKNVKEKRGKDFSSKEKLSLKSTLTDVVTVSSDSSEDETDFIRRSTLNKCKAITGRIKHKKKYVKSCVKETPSEVSKGSGVVTIKKKSKGKTILQDADISPKKELSKIREKESSVPSDSDEPCSNKKRIRKKCAKRNSLGTTPTRNNVLLKSGISTPYPQFSPVFQDAERDDIITVSSDSSVSSDADTFEKIKVENSPKKRKARKNKRKIYKRSLESFLVNKPSNISKTMFRKSNSESIRNDSVDDSPDDDVCLLDSSNLSKSDAFPSTKEHTSSKLPSVKDRFILEKKNYMKNVERSHKLRIPNSTTVEECNSRVCSAEGNISLSLKNKTSENVENCRYDQKCSSDSAESIENVDEPLCNSRKSCQESFDTRNKNRKKDNSERLTNLKTLTRSKAFDSTESRNNSENSFINCHSDISSNVLSDSDLLSNDLRSSSDEDVLFQGFYEAVNSCTSNKGYKSSENETVSEKDTPFILQSNNLKNPNKVQKFDNDTEHGSANDNRSFASSSSSKIDTLEEIVGEANFGKEVSRSNFIDAKRSELKIKKLDLIPEPVDFEIPLLHEYERLDKPSKEQRAKWEEQGFNLRKIRKFTPEEDEILKKNFMDFSRKYGISDPARVFGIDSDCKVDSTLKKFLRVKHFYLRLGKNLNDRTLFSIYHRARIIYHPNYSPNPKKWSSEEISKLKELQKIYGNNWNKIGHLLNRRGINCHSAFYYYRSSKNGKT